MSALASVTFGVKVYGFLQWAAAESSGRRLNLFLFPV
jgi:hypothetical protein